MDTTHAFRLSEKQYRDIALFAALLVAIAGLPAIIHSQYVTGPLVNAALLIATATLGAVPAIMLGMISSPIALASGLLPLPLAPMVPFIMLGNAVLVLAFHSLYKRSFVSAVAAAAVLKFALLSGTVAYVLSTMLPAPLVKTLGVMMGLPQLVTALLGGVLAYGALLAVKKL